MTTKTEIKHRTANLRLALSGQRLAQKFVQICMFCARPNGSGSPACAKPSDHCVSCGESVFEKGSGIEKRVKSDNVVEKVADKFVEKL
jgi:hypothetical protein